MQYRLYMDADKSMFFDPKNVLLRVHDFYELDGDNEDKSFEKIRALFPHAKSAPSATDCIRTSVFLRNGRSDRALDEMNEVIELIKPRSPIRVRLGREFFFNDNATPDTVEEFMNENVNRYVHIGTPFLGTDEDTYVPEPQVGPFCTASYIELVATKERLGIKMDIDDLMCVQNYFISESREPSYTELKIIDSFFSENFRHTTFETILDRVDAEDPSVKQAWEHYRELHGGRMPSLSDITQTPLEVMAPENVVMAGKKLRGVKIKSRDDEAFLLVAKNESHNRSVSAVPYDGAAGAVGGALKDVLCVFGHAFDSYRVIGKGKNEKHRKKALWASAGYAETASAIGVPCSKCKETVSELYNEKQLEVCSILALSDMNSTEKMLARVPQVSDRIYLVGGRSGADGPGCAKITDDASHSLGEFISVSDSGELAALQRVFTRPELADIAVAINDVGSGGIVCALGEMVDGADISLENIKLKYGGLTCADIVLSESNERMLVCVRSENAMRLENICKAEGVECSCIAVVNDSGRFVIYDGQGRKFVSLTSEFLLSGGAEKHLSAYVDKPEELPESDALVAVRAPYDSASGIKKLFGKTHYDFERAYLLSAGKIAQPKCEFNRAFDRSAGGSKAELSRASFKKDYSERVLSYVGKDVLSADGGAISTASSCATLPEISKVDPFRGAYLSVTEAVTKLIAAGYGENDIYLSLQEYFPEHKNSSKRLGVAVASMLGVFEAQMQLGTPSVGGRISIGNGVKDYETACSVTAFAFCVSNGGSGIRSVFQKPGNKIILLTPELEKSTALPSGDEIKRMARTVSQLKSEGRIHSSCCVNAKNVCTAIMEMCRAEKAGVSFYPDSSVESIFADTYCSILLEVDPDTELPKDAELIGTVTADYRFEREGQIFELAGALGSYSRRPVTQNEDGSEYLYLKGSTVPYGKVKPIVGEKVRVLMPITAYTVAAPEIKEAFTALGAEVKTVPLDANGITDLVRNLKKTDILWLGDSLGSAAFMTAVLTDKRVKVELEALCERKGLIYGCGSSFEALIRSGMLDIDPRRFSFATNDGGMLNAAVNLRVCSQYSPFMNYSSVDKVYRGYVTGKRLRVTCDKAYADMLAKEGRILTQYAKGYNAPASDQLIDSVCSSDGLVMGQVSKTVLGMDAVQTVRSAVGYFSTYNMLEGGVPYVE